MPGRALATHGMHVTRALDPDTDDDRVKSRRTLTHGECPEMRAANNVTAVTISSTRTLDSDDRAMEDPHHVRTCRRR